MKYYQTTCGKLIKHFEEKDFYVITNNVKLTDKKISTEDFQKLQKTQIKNQRFSELMNIYFKNVKENWSFEHKNYRNLDNFESNTVQFSKHYEIGKNIPYHKIDGISYRKDLLLVYHWGRVYYFLHRDGDKGVLISAKTLKMVRWAKLKHCAPIFDVDLKKII